MQLLKCPFCGDRPESEFHYEGEAGTLRPEPAAEVSAADWADYLFFNRNPRGTSAEIWMHLPCGELFEMTRDTTTGAVLSARAFGEEGA